LTNDNLLIARDHRAQEKVQEEAPVGAPGAELAG
jgi:hypothetical protein